MQGPLFWYPWPQAFVDFRHRVDSLGSNHFYIAMNAFLRQRQKCIQLRNAQPTNYPTFGTNAWGLTSGMASLGYLELRLFAGFCTENTNYGVAAGCTNWVHTDEEACDSGTLTPICLPACMSHVPYEARPAMKHLYDTYDNASNNVYDLYSFRFELSRLGGALTSPTNPDTVVSYLDDGTGTGNPPGHTSVVQRTYRVRAYAP